MRDKPVCKSCANEKRILPNQPSIAVGNINEETVLLADAVRLGPCSCVFCKDCFLQYVISTRLEPKLHCPDCGNLIESHRTTITKECHASVKHQDRKYALTPPREILDVVQHNWDEKTKSCSTQPLVTNMAFPEEENVTRTKTFTRILGQEKDDEFEKRNEENALDESQNKQNGDGDDVNVDDGSGHDSDYEPEFKEIEEKDLVPTAPSQFPKHNEGNVSASAMVENVVDRESHGSRVTTPKARKKAPSNLATSRMTRSMAKATAIPTPRATRNIQQKPSATKNKRAKKLTGNTTENYSSAVKTNTKQKPPATKNNTAENHTGSTTESSSVKTVASAVKKSSTADTAAPATSAAKKRKVQTPEFAEEESPRKKRGRRPFDEHFRNLQAYKDEHGHCWVFQTNKDTVLHNWVDGVRKGRRLLAEDEKQKLNKIGFIWNDEKPKGIPDHRLAKKKRSFQEKYELLLDYKEKHGHCWVYKKHKDRPLYLWVLSIREGQRPVDAEERVKLDQIGFIWQKSKPEYIPDHPTSMEKRSFEEHYKSLIRYKENYGHCWVYPRHRDRCFYRWVIDVRKGQQPINDEERAKLDEIGFIWDLKKPDDIPEKTLIRKFRTFDEFFQMLVEYKEEHGHCWVYRKHDKGFSNWVHEVRKGQRKISDEQKEKLIQVGFIWDNERPEGIPDYPKKKRVRQFEEFYEKLKAHHAEHGDCLVPIRGQQDKAFARWIREVRTGKRTVRAYEKAKLEELDFPFDTNNEDELDPEKVEKIRELYPRRITFDERFQDLLEYKNEHGDCMVRHRYKEKNNLGEWVYAVRIGVFHINREQRRKLNEVGFIWETKKNRFEREWNEKLEQLKRFKALYGDCRPKETGVYKQLCEWCRTQRKMNNKNKLREDRKALLDELDFPWNAAKSLRRTHFNQEAYESYHRGNDSYTSGEEEYGDTCG